MANTAFEVGFSKGSSRGTGDDTNTSGAKPSSGARKAGGGGIPGMIGGAIQKKQQKMKAGNTLKKAQTPSGGLSTTQDVAKAVIPQAKKGGKVMKSGLAVIHRGEIVVPAKQVKQAKRSGGKASRKRTSIKT